jgi:hypothetical protein
MKLDFADLPPLTEPCTCTGGPKPWERIKYDGDGQPYKCVECNGYEKPTEFGEAVLALIENFGKYKKESET